MFVSTLSKQVKAGIQSTGGPKSFTAFGVMELAAFGAVAKVEMFDLMELIPGSVALKSAALHDHQEKYRVHKKNTGLMIEDVKNVIAEHVNPVD